MQLPQGKKIYFISDFHLGVPDQQRSLEREKKIVRWLEQIKADAAILYLMGDVFDSFKTNMKRAIDELYMLNNRKQLKLASHITTKELPEIIDLGIEQMSMYHPNLPLLRTKNGNITSEDLKLLYYYHNRMDGYGLQKYIG